MVKDVGRYYFKYLLNCLPSIKMLELLVQGQCILLYPVELMNLVVSLCMFICCRGIVHDIILTNRYDVSFR